MAGLWPGKDLQHDGMTIAAVATAFGAASCGQRSLIRLSGPAVRTGLGQIIRILPTGRCAVAVRLFLPGRGEHAGREVSVPALALRGVAPLTFTGEDTLEILLPAHPHLVQRLLAVLCEVPGVRHAHPGEFSARAFLAGKMSLDEAQHVAALIAATREEEIAAAQRVRTGEPGRSAIAWADEIAEILALVEAGIDFADQEDVVAIGVPERCQRISRLLDDILRDTGCEGEVRGSKWDALARVVLWGAPNAGKSTLFNALLGVQRAVASPIAGTTRDALEEEWEPAVGDVVKLVDVAGVSEIDPREPVDSAAQDAARRALLGADVVLWCDPTGRFDARGTPPVGDAVCKIVRVRTMADVPRADAGQQADCAVCGLDGWNLDSLAQSVHRALRQDHVGIGGSRASSQLMLVPRHRAAVLGAVRRLKEAIEHAASDELCATALRAALDSLAEMTGQISTEEVLGRVFARFCIGK